MKTTPQSGNLGYFIFMSQKENVSRQCLPYLHISDAKQAFEADPESAVLNFLGFLKRTGCWCRVQTFFYFLRCDERKQELRGGVAWGRAWSIAHSSTGKMKMLMKIKRFHLFHGFGFHGCRMSPSRREKSCFGPPGAASGGSH